MDRPLIGLYAKAYCGPEGLTLEQLVRPENEMTLLRTVNLSLNKSLVDVTTRGSIWRLNVGTLKEGTAEGEMMVTQNGRDCRMFMDAFLQDFNLSMFFSNGVGEGLFGDFGVNQMSQNQALEEAIIANYSVAPALTARVPQWIKTDVGQGPIITSPPEFDGVAGTAVSFQLTASPAALKWTATSLPAGLTLAEATGVISGTIDEPGVFWPYVTAANDAGSMTRIIQIVIEE